MIMDHLLRRKGFARAQMSLQKSHGSLSSVKFIVEIYKARKHVNTSRGFTDEYYLANKEAFM